MSENQFPEHQFPKFHDRMIFTLQTMIKFKKALQKKGLRKGRAKCPTPGCDGMLHGVLLGKKDHLHFHCDGPCNMRGME